ncbi:MAG: MBL fold metallo-hydrolase [Candidatus Woesearchaeota archaeon]
MAEPAIIFLGTGGDSVVVGKQLRGSGGIILHVNDYQFHIDPGPGALVRALQFGVNVRENTAVLVSHAHTNHCNDVNAVLSAMTYNGLDIKGVLVANDTLVNGLENEPPFLTKFHREMVERIINIKHGQKIGIEDIEIHALKARHTDPNSLGFCFLTPNFSMCYSSDTGPSPEVIEQYEKFDILILNSVYPSGQSSKDNLSCDDVLSIISKVKPKLAVITHFGSKMLQADPLYEARELQKKSGCQVVAAKDGLSINPLSYATRQRTLNSY